MSSYKIIVPIYIAACSIIACSNEQESFDRPSNIPPKAVPAIGADGGAWANCLYIEPPHVQCEIFFASTGDVWARGTYLLETGDELSQIRSAEHLDQLMTGFSLFNGHTIQLSDSNRLIPDGIIDSPFANGGGKSTEYSKGTVVRAEKQYE